jgi:anti-sigma-K factor RskA
MRYDNPQLQDALAREYVLGTLRGRARARFANVIAASLPARRAVLGWEQRLAPLARAVPAVEPPPHVWANIEAAIGGRTRPKAPPSDSQGSRGAGWWPALAAGLAALAVLFGGLYLGQQPQLDQPRYVSVIEDQATGPIWLLQAFTAELRVSTITPRPEPAGNSYELWMLPDGGAPPVSLGLIPGVGTTALPLDAQALTVLAQTMTLAVSLEPAGGSPTGLPTGPVIFTAPLLRV